MNDPKAAPKVEPKSAPEPMVDPKSSLPPKTEPQGVTAAEFVKARDEFSLANPASVTEWQGLVDKVQACGMSVEGAGPSGAVHECFLRDAKGEAVKETVKPKPQPALAAKK